MVIDCAESLDYSNSELRSYENFHMENLGLRRSERRVSGSALMGQALFPLKFATLTKIVLFHS